jgi:hypothetical protein
MGTQPFGRVCPTGNSNLNLLDYFKSIRFSIQYKYVLSYFVWLRRHTFLLLWRNSRSHAIEGKSIHSFAMFAETLSKFTECEHDDGWCGCRQCSTIASAEIRRCERTENRQQRTATENSVREYATRYKDYTVLDSRVRVCMYADACVLLVHSSCTQSRNRSGENKTESRPTITNATWRCSSELAASRSLDTRMRVITAAM